MKKGLIFGFLVMLVSIVPATMIDKGLEEDVDIFSDWNTPIEEDVYVLEHEIGATNQTQIDFSMDMTIETILDNLPKGYDYFDFEPLEVEIDSMLLSGKIQGNILNHICSWTPRPYKRETTKVEDLESNKLQVKDVKIIDVKNGSNSYYRNCEGNSTATMNSEHWTYKTQSIWIPPSSGSDGHYITVYDKDEKVFNTNAKDGTGIPKDAKINARTTIANVDNGELLFNVDLGKDYMGRDAKWFDVTSNFTNTPMVVRAKKSFKKQRQAYDLRNEKLVDNFSELIKSEIGFLDRSLKFEDIEKVMYESEILESGKIPNFVEIRWNHEDEPWRDEIMGTFSVSGELVSPPTPGLDQETKISFEIDEMEIISFMSDFKHHNRHNRMLNSYLQDSRTSKINKDTSSKDKLVIDVNSTTDLVFIDRTLEKPEGFIEKIENKDNRYPKWTNEDNYWKLDSSYWNKLQDEKVIPLEYVIRFKNPKREDLDLELNIKQNSEKVEIENVYGNDYLVKHYPAIIDDRMNDYMRTQQPFYINYDEEMFTSVELYENGYKIGDIGNGELIETRGNYDIYAIDIYGLKHDLYIDYHLPNSRVQARDFVNVRDKYACELETLATEAIEQGIVTFEEEITLGDYAQILRAQTLVNQLHILGNPGDFPLINVLPEIEIDNNPIRPEEHPTDANKFNDAIIYSMIAMFSITTLMSLSYYAYEKIKG